MSEIKILEINKCSLDCSCGWNIKIGGKDMNDMEKILEYIHTLQSRGEADTKLIISLQAQVADLRKNAREIARKDAIQEERDRIRSEVKRITKLYEVNDFSLDAEILRHIFAIINNTNEK